MSVRDGGVIISIARPVDAIEGTDSEVGWGRSHQLIEIQEALCRKLNDAVCKYGHLKHSTIDLFWNYVKL